MVSADPIQLEQVVVNLLVNGIDALEQCGSDRHLTIETCQTTGGDVEVLVADNGCGLPADYEHKIFESFFTTKDHGLGMGLAISRSMVEAHGGRLSAEGNDQGGATFRFTLPRHSEPSHAL
jgi:C4-dicarboxylate-specific signal transduction histidine kinase